jgi:ribose 5-phosphate isomerase
LVLFLFLCHGFVIDDPLYYEKLFQKIDGVIEVGIFAEHKPHIVVTGFDYGYELKES